MAAQGIARFKTVCFLCQFDWQKQDLYQLSGLFSGRKIPRQNLEQFVLIPSTDKSDQWLMSCGYSLTFSWPWKGTVQRGKLSNQRHIIKFPISNVKLGHLWCQLTQNPLGRWGRYRSSEGGAFGMECPHDVHGLLTASVLHCQRAVCCLWKADWKARCYCVNITALACS